MAAKAKAEKKPKAPKAPLTLTGRVYCDWNCFTMMAPKPDVVERGDLIIWGWSGDSKKPQSKASAGLLRVSVFDGKTRRTLLVKRTRLHSQLKYSGERERENKLSVLIPELRALSGRTLEKGKGGLQVAPMVVAPPSPAPAATPSQGTLF